MSRSVKIFGTVVIIFIALAGASFYFISTKINPEMIRKITKEAIESNLSGVEAKIELVDYELGSSIKVLVKNLQIIKKDTKSKMLELGSIEVKVPLLAILTSGGTIDILAETPKLYVLKQNGKINWVEATEKEVAKEAAGVPKKVESSGKMEVPEFVNKSKINFRVKDAEFLLNMGPESKSKFILNKIVLKNINLIKTTAFEVSSQIEHQLSPEEFLRTKIQVIGEVNLKKLVEAKEVETSLNIKVEDTKLGQMSIPLFRAKTSVKGSFDNINVDINGSLDSIMELKTLVNYQANKISISSIDLNLNPASGVKAFAPDLTQSLGVIDFNDTRIQVQGGASISLDPLAVSPDMTFQTTKNLNINAAPEFPLSSGIKGKIKDQDILVTAKNEILSGVINADIETKFDPLNIPKELVNFNPIQVSVMMNGLKVEKAFIQKTLWGDKKKKAAPTPDADAQPSEYQPGEKILLPKVSVKIMGENIFIADQEISTEGQINIFRDNVAIDKFLLKYGEGVVQTQANLNLVNTNHFKTNFDLNFNKVEVSAFNAFFPPYLSELKGVFVGKVNGDATLAKETKFNVSAKVQGTNGDLKNLNIAAIIGPILENVSVLKGKIPKKQNISSKFEKLYADVVATNEVINLKKLKVDGHEKTSELVMAGNVSMLDKNSVLTGTIYMQQNEKELKNITGQTKFPFRLSGVGFAIYNPDIGYTTDKLTKAAGKQLEKNAKAQLKKEEKKVKAQIKKEQKKLEKKANAEVKKQKKKIEDELKKKLKGIKF